MENEKVVVLDKNNEIVTLLSVIKGTIDKIAEKDAISASKGKVVVSSLLDTLISNDDPFIRALATLGNEKAINTLGVLLFVSFQLGVNFGSGAYKFPETEES